MDWLHFIKSQMLIQKFSRLNESYEMLVISVLLMCVVRVGGGTQGSDVTLNLVRWNFACWCRTTLKRVGRPYREQWIWSQLDQSFLWSAMNVSLGRVCCIESGGKLLQRDGLVVASWSCTIQYCNGSWTSQQEFNVLDIETSSFRLKWISKKGFLKFQEGWCSRGKWWNLRVNKLKAGNQARRSALRKMSVLHNWNEASLILKSFLENASRFRIKFRRKLKVMKFTRK